MYREALFYLFSILCVITAIVTITRRNPVYSALFLISHLICIALTIALFKTAYLTAIHILVYTGAIMVLFLFIIMLLNLKDDELGAELPLVFRSLYLLVPFALVAVSVNFKAVKPIDFGLFKGITFQAATNAMFDKYFIAFEIVSALIILAIVGSVVIAKKRL